MIFFEWIQNLVTQDIFYAFHLPKFPFQKPSPATVKKPKLKIDKKPPETPAKPPPPPQSSTPAQQQPQIVTILQQQPQQQQQIKLKTEPQQQIILSMSQAQAMLQTQQQKNAVYTFPTNLILNANGTFMTSTGDVFKFDNNQ